MPIDERVIFPQRLYVFPLDFDNDEPIFGIGNNLHEVELGNVAVYELKSKGRVTQSFKFKKEKK